MLAQRQDPNLLAIRDESCNLKRSPWADLQGP